MAVTGNPKTSATFINAHIYFLGFVVVIVVFVLLLTLLNISLIFIIRNSENNKNSKIKSFSSVFFKGICCFKSSSFLKRLPVFYNSNLNVSKAVGVEERGQKLTFIYLFN